MSGNLDAFIISPKPQPRPIATSQEIRDRASLFVATIYAVATRVQAEAAVSHLANVTHAQKPASHEMYAWRCMVPKAGHTGLSGPDDFEVREGSSDDGERGGGEKILAVLRRQGVIDAVVIVSRWYGGIMLGPARFSHIETCTFDVCREFKRVEEVKETLATLQTLDDILAQLRSDLAACTRQTYTQAKVPDYAAWIDSDLPKARRLIRAREGAIKSVKSLIAAAQQRQET